MAMCVNAEASIFCVLHDKRTNFRSRLGNKKMCVVLGLSGSALGRLSYVFVCLDFDCFAYLEIFVCFESEYREPVDDVFLDEGLLGLFPPGRGPLRFDCIFLFAAVIVIRFVLPYGLHALRPFPPSIPLFYLVIHSWPVDSSLQQCLRTAARMAALHLAF